MIKQGLALSSPIWLRSGETWIIGDRQGVILLHPKEQSDFDRFASQFECRYALLIANIVLDCNSYADGVVLIVAPGRITEQLSTKRIVNQLKDRTST